MSTIVDLSDLGDRGFAIRGANRKDYAGHSVASAGDINGDGFADVIVGALGATGGAYREGEAIVIYGKANGFGPITISDLSKADGFLMRGDQNDEWVGGSVASAGDVNGDGLVDMIVGATGFFDHSTSGEAYVIFGQRHGFRSFDIGDLAPDAGIVLQNDDGSYLTRSVASAGDVNGDGFADLIIGAPNQYSSGTGRAYVVFGRAEGPPEVDLTHLTPADGFAVTGWPGDSAGYSVASAGDVNGDGLSDLIIGAPYRVGSGRGRGDAYVVFGKADGLQDIDLTRLARNDGFVMTGGGGSSSLNAFSVSSAGDMNGDGFADVIVGSPNADEFGQAYVVFGKASGFSPVDLTALKPPDGFVIFGPDEPGDRAAGRSVAAAGDVNGDGFGDVIVGVPYSGDEGKGQAYVLYGKAHGFAAVELASLAPSDGFVIQGEANGDAAGVSVASAGDVDGDGFADVIVGASRSDSEGRDSGSAYVIFGMAPIESVTRLGTDIAQTIHGGLGDDTLNGLGGDDMLIGAEGGDTLIGGNGRDVLDGGIGDDALFGGSRRDRLDGGAGQDVLTGGLQGDRFHFVVGDTTASAATADRITDFSQAEHDFIGLKAYDAMPGTPDEDPFTFVGTAAFSGAVGELRYEVAGADTLVSGDTNGDKVADFTIVLTGAIALTSADFLFAAAATPLAAGAHLFLAQVDLHANPHLHLA